MATLLKEKTRHVFISAMNFVRVRLFEGTELNTPEKKIRDEKEKEKALVHYEKIMKNIGTCQNKLQIDTAHVMIDQFYSRYGRLCHDKYLNLQEKMNERKDQLCMYF